MPEDLNPTREIIQLSDPPLEGEVITPRQKEEEDPDRYYPKWLAFRALDRVMAVLRDSTLDYQALFAKTAGEWGEYKFKRDGGIEAEVVEEKGGSCPSKSKGSSNEAEWTTHKVRTESRDARLRAKAKHLDEKFKASQEAAKRAEILQKEIKAKRKKRIKVGLITATGLGIVMTCAAGVSAISKSVESAIERRNARIELNQQQAAQAQAEREQTTQNTQPIDELNTGEDPQDQGDGWGVFGLAVVSGVILTSGGYAIFGKKSSDEPEGGSPNPERLSRAGTLSKFRSGRL